MAILHALPLTPQRIKSKFLLSTDKMLKPAGCSLPSLYKVKLFGRLFKSPDGSLFQEMLWTAWPRTDWNPEEYETKVQVPYQFWMILDNHCSIQGRDSGRCLEQFSQSLSGASLPFEFSLTPARRSDQPDQWPGCPRPGGGRSLPTIRLHSLTFSHHCPPCSLKHTL